MAGKINLYNLGSRGVNVTKSPSQLDDGELVQAQNAIPDPRGKFGSISKRDGMLAVNSVDAGDVITSMVGVPLPAITVHKFYVARDQAISATSQWVTSSDSFATTATEVTTVGSVPSAIESVARAVGGVFDQLRGRIVSTERLIIFPGNHTASVSDPIIIKSWDGSVVRPLFTIPANPLVTMSPLFYVQDMLQDGNFIYIITHDSNDSNNFRGRVFRYDMTTGYTFQIGEGFGPLATEVGGGIHLPATLIIFQGSLWVGTTPANISISPGRVYRIRPGVETNYTLDSNVGLQGITSMASFKGLLYAGTWQFDNLPALLKVRDAAGTWTTASTTGGVGVFNNSKYAAVIVFGDYIYASEYFAKGASSTSKIFRSADGVTWTAVATISASGADPIIGVSAMVHDGTLYVLACNTTGSGAVYSTVDGTTWLNTSSNLGSAIFSQFGVIMS